MIYAKAFFDLQLEFAQAVRALSGLPLAQVLLEYTNFYVRFGLGRDFDPGHPGWREYLAGLGDTIANREWTYRFYATRPPVTEPSGVVATFGCFSYARLGPDRIRLHFQDAETNGHSPLAIERRDHRRAELAALVDHVTRAEPEGVRLVGASWLYNLEAYRRLFPPSYLATARVIRHRFQHMPLWGQFVDRYGETKDGMARRLLERLARQSSLDDLDQCFPLHVLALEAPVRDLHEWYSV